MLSTAFNNHTFAHRKDIHGIRETVNALVGAVSSLTNQSNNLPNVGIYNQTAEQFTTKNIDNNLHRIQPAAVSTKKTISKQTAERAQRRKQDRTYKQAV